MDAMDSILRLAYYCIIIYNFDMRDNWAFVAQCTTIPYCNSEVTVSCGRILLLSFASNDFLKSFGFSCPLLVFDTEV